MMFASREEAGDRLAGFLQQQRVQADLVLGLPRGGVVVGAAVARALKLPLDVLVVRKIGHPLQREFAVGAMAENGVVVLDEEVVGHDPVIRAELQEIIKEERERLHSYRTLFQGARALDRAEKVILLVDDGLATGATAEAAALSATRQKARRILVAAPVASSKAVERLAKVADEVFVLWTDPDFDAVGRYYEVFSQTTDEEVRQLLKRA